ncbi:MAG: hypothetical protein QOH96_1301 [Blastocatellia bacterium]|jgi:hypothetical protein|nr:hypothetical protein [Blastocatellia bacterium]
MFRLTCDLRCDLSSLLINWLNPKLSEHREKQARGSIRLRGLESTVGSGIYRTQIRRGVCATTTRNDVGMRQRKWQAARILGEGYQQLDGFDEADGRADREYLDHRSRSWPSRREGTLTPNGPILLALMLVYTR